MSARGVEPNRAPVLSMTQGKDRLRTPKWYSAIAFVEVPNCLIDTIIIILAPRNVNDFLKNNRRELDILFLSSNERK